MQHIDPIIIQAGSAGSY